MADETTNTITRPEPKAPAKGIQVTDKALVRIRSAMAKEGISAVQGGLRLGVQGGGCSGLSYNIRFDTQPCERDRVSVRRCARIRGSEVVHLPARHDPRLSRNIDAARLRLRESQLVEVLWLRKFVLRVATIANRLTVQAGF
jgi:hypothetical protein